MASAESITPWKAWRRKWFAVRTVAQTDSGEPVSQRDLQLRATELQKSALAASRLEDRTAILWLLESLGARFLRSATSAATLNDDQLPREVRPILHSGMGVAAVEKGEFDAEKITRIIDAFSHPDYREFAYESVGAMMAVYQKGAFYLSARILRRLGVIRMPKLHPPADLQRFWSQFPPEIRPLISHGFGRLLYFRNHTLATAIRNARKLAIHKEAALRGVAFAFAMVNSRDIESVLMTATRLPTNIQETFQDGLVYALVFWEWIAPGFLEQLQDRQTGASLVARASRQLGMNREMGRLTAFNFIG